MPAERVRLQGTLVIPDRARGIVVFVHGSGSSRLSPHNRAVANTLQASGLATLLFDLLVQDEAERDSLTAKYRFDIPRLVRRLPACWTVWQLARKRAGWRSDYSAQAPAQRPHSRRRRCTARGACSRVEGRPAGPRSRCAGSSRCTDAADCERAGYRSCRTQPPGVRPVDV